MTAKASPNAAPLFFCLVYADLAQLVERRADNAKVPSSILGVCTKHAGVTELGIGTSLKFYLSTNFIYSFAINATYR